MVPLDGSTNSLRGLKFALKISKQSSLSIIGLNVISPLIIEKIPSVKENSKDVIRQAELISQKINVPFLGMTKISNNVGKTIITFAENHKVDMIIIGSRGPDPYHEIFLGSVANYLVNKSKIPITVVK